MQVGTVAQQPLSRVMGRQRHDAQTSRIDSTLVRLFDVTVAALLLILLLPAFLLVAAAVFVSDPGPILFAHPRVGRGGKLFRCLKFRTMTVDADKRLADLLACDAAARAEWARDHKLRNDPRITRFGLFLRKSSIDELPQLWNVLRGEMSIVGPRPIVIAETGRYSRFFADYAAVKPGITGLWQVSGRNNTTYRRRVALDVSYARSKSIMFDLRIVAMTVPAVLAAKGSF
jgi:exopolysaccharide production protein ExoY